MGKRRPSAKQQEKVRTAERLTVAAHRSPDIFAACGICGEPAEHLRALRECDEFDQPIPGDDGLLFVGEGHRACDKVVSDHPRLYEDTHGRPGYFPRICGPCVHRDGFACRHPDLKANGGAGLVVTMPTAAEWQGMGNVIVCGRGGCWRPPRVATACAGRRTLRLVPDTGAPS